MFQRANYRKYACSISYCSLFEEKHGKEIIHVFIAQRYKCKIMLYKSIAWFLSPMAAITEMWDFLNNFTRISNRNKITKISFKSISKQSR